MAIYTTTATGAQDGYGLIAAWDEAAATLLVTVAAGAIGLQFVVFSEFDAENRPIAPPMIHPSFDLTLTDGGIVWGVSTEFDIDVSFVPEAAPEPYSAALLPTQRDEVLLVSDTWDNPDTSVTITVPTALMQEYVRQADWNGIISLTVEADVPALQLLSVNSAEGADPTLAPSINTTEVPFHTGEWEGPAFGRRARTRHCPRTGMPVASDHMIRDGYVEGMMVSHEGWEPIDPEDRYVPSPLEGVVDDEV